MSGILLEKMENPEQVYENVPFCEKENAGFPHFYHDLSIDQRFLVDRLVELSYNNTDYSELVDNLQYVKSEIDNIVNTVTQESK